MRTSRAWAQEQPRRQIRNGLRSVNAGAVALLLALSLPRCDSASTRAADPAKTRPLTKDEIGKRLGAGTPSPVARGGTEPGAESQAPAQVIRHTRLVTLLPKNVPLPGFRAGEATSETQRAGMSASSFARQSFLRDTGKPRERAMILVELRDSSIAEKVHAEFDRNVGVVQGADGGIAGVSLREVKGHRVISRSDPKQHAADLTTVDGRIVIDIKGIGGVTPDDLVRVLGALDLDAIGRLLP